MTSTIAILVALALGIPGQTTIRTSLGKGIAPTGGTVTPGGGLPPLPWLDADTIAAWAFEANPLVDDTSTFPNFTLPATLALTTGKSGNGLHDVGAGSTGGPSVAANSPFHQVFIEHAGQGWTIEGWVNVTSVSASIGTYLINCGDVQGYELWELSILSNGSAAALRFNASFTGGTINLPFATAYTMNVGWHHVGARYVDSAATISLFVDGVKSDVAQLLTTFNRGFPQYMDFFMGYTGQPYPGVLDSFRVHSVAHTDAWFVQEAKP